MSKEFLDRARDELEKAGDAATDEDVEEQLRDRAEQIERMAQRMGSSDSDRGTIDHEQDALQSVSVDAGDAAQGHITEANKQLGKFRDSISY